MTEGLRVIELRTENFMGIRLAEVRPEGDMVVIGGSNGAGKTSLLNAIECAIRGKRFHPERPVRDGEESGEIVLDLGALKIRRKFKADGAGTISVETPDGMRPKKPQELLDSLAGAIAFDPLEFSRMDPAARLALVRELAGVDVSDLDRKRTAAYDKRTDEKRTAKTLTSQLDALVYHKEAPEEPVSIHDLLEELDTARQQLNENAGERDELENLGHMATAAERSIEGATEELRRMEAQVAEQAANIERLRVERSDIDNRTEGQERVVSQLIDPDTEAINHRIANAEQTNKLVSENRQHTKLKAERGEHATAADELSKEIEALGLERAARIGAAELPVEGMSFGEDGVTFNGIPFAQLSSAEQLRVSVGMGMELNPKLHVMLVRDGSLLDADSMELIAGMAKERGYQCWLERVGTADAGAIVIEAGEIVGAEAATEAA